jgi:hypothetical protein
MEAGAPLPSDRRLQPGHAPASEIYSGSDGEGRAGYASERHQSSMSAGAASSACAERSEPEDVFPIDVYGEDTWIDDEDDEENVTVPLGFNVFPQGDDFAQAYTTVMGAAAEGRAANMSNVGHPNASVTVCCWGDLGRKYLIFDDQFCIHPEFLLRYPFKSKEWKVDQHDTAMKAVAMDHNVNISNLVADDYFLHPEARTAALASMRGAYLAKARVRTCAHTHSPFCVRLHAHAYFSVTRTYTCII